MRTSLLPGLLEAVQKTWRRGVTEARLITVGATFAPGGDASGLPREVSRYAAILAGMRPGYLSKPEPFDVSDVKGIALELVERVTGRAARVGRQVDAVASHLHPRGAADVF